MGAGAGACFDLDDLVAVDRRGRRRTGGVDARRSRMPRRRAARCPERTTIGRVSLVRDMAVPFGFGCVVRAEEQRFGTGAPIPSGDRTSVRVMGRWGCSIELVIARGETGRLLLDRRTGSASTASVPARAKARRPADRPRWTELIVGAGKSIRNRLLWSWRQRDITVRRWLAKFDLQPRARGPRSGPWRQAAVVRGSAAGTDGCDRYRGATPRGAGEQWPSAAREGDPRARGRRAQRRSRRLLGQSIGALQFHHVDSTAKAFALSSGPARSPAKAREEIR